MSDGKENREAFFNRLEPRLAPSQLRDVQLAYTLAKFSHRAQTRMEKDEHGNPVRYFEHPRRVTLVLLDEVGIYEPELIISSLLHDSVEDTRDITPEMLEHCFGADVVRIVKTLSKVPKEGYLERFLTSSDWRPYVIKACDRLDNIRSLAGTDTEFAMKQLNETVEKYGPLFRRMHELAPEVFKPRVQELQEKIDTAWAKGRALAMGLRYY